MIPREKIRSTVHSMPVSAMGGVGEKTAGALRSLGIRTIGDLAGMDETHLRRLFGKNGSHILQSDCSSQLILRIA